MKRIPLLLVFLTITRICFANPFTYTSRNNYSGIWLNEATWSHTPVIGWEMTQPGNPTNSNAGGINVYGYIRSEGTLTVNNSSPHLIIYDTLYVDGDLSLGSSARMTINPGGILVVTGTLTIKGSFNLGNDGKMVVKGNFNITNGRVTNNENIYVYGNTTASGGGTVNGCNPYGGCSPYSTIEDRDDLQDTNSPLFDFVEGGGVLPVTLLDFDGSNQGNRVVLKWSTATEKDNDFFTIRRSFDGLEFTSLTYIQGAGTTNGISYYQYEDYISGSDRNTPVYYELSQTDYDGTHEKLKVIVLGKGKLDQMKLLPNAVSKDGTINVTGATADLSWKVVSLSGNLLKSGDFMGSSLVSVDGLNNGYYFLQITSDNGASRSMRFVVR